MKRIYLLMILIAGVQSNAQCWKTISAENKHVVAIKEDLTLWTWGANESGQLGNNSSVNKNTPIQVGIGSSWICASAGYEFTVAIKSDGTLWTWGNNEHYQLGNGTTTSKIVPTQIGTDTNWKYVSAGEVHAIATKLDGTLWQWGVSSMHMEDGDTKPDAYLKTPTQIGVESNWTDAQIAAGGLHSLALKADGTLWAWGNNSVNQLGNNTGIDVIQPIQIGTDTDWKFVNAGTGSSFGIKTNGKLYGWGLNDGRIGTGTATDAPIAITQIGSLTNWKFVDGGNMQTIGFTTTGEVYAWGGNHIGQLGDGTTSDSPILAPKLILTDANVVNVTSGDSQTYILSSTNGISGSGDNSSGELGDGSTTSKSTSSNVPCPTSYLGVNDFTKNILSVYPNPARDILSLDLEDAAAAYEIFDISGKRIASEKLSKKEINVSGLSKGIYLLKVVTSEGTLNAKFIKE